MELTVNGERRTVPEGMTVADLVRATCEDDRGVAVAVDGEVVSRSRWTCTLADGSVIELVTATNGG